MDKCNDCQKLHNPLDTLRCNYCQGVLCRECAPSHHDKSDVTQVTLTITLHDPTKMSDERLEHIHHTLTKDLDNLDLGMLSTTIRSNGYSTQCNKGDNDVPF